MNHFGKVKVFKSNGPDMTIHSLAFQDAETSEFRLAPRLFLPVAGLKADQEFFGGGRDGAFADGFPRLLFGGPKLGGGLRSTHREPQPDATLLVFRFAGAFDGFAVLLGEHKHALLAGEFLVESDEGKAIEIAKDARVLPLPLGRVVEMDFDDEAVLE